MEYLDPDPSTGCRPKLMGRKRRRATPPGPERFVEKVQLLFEKDIYFWTDMNYYKINDKELLTRKETIVRPYGIPRTLDVAFPDVGDIRRFGLASHVGSLPGKSGDFHPYCRGEKKARTRRIWKRRERTNAARAIRAILTEFFSSRTEG